MVIIGNSFLYSFGSLGITRIRKWRYFNCTHHCYLILGVAETAHCIFRVHSSLSKSLTIFFLVVLNTFSKFIIKCLSITIHNLKGNIIKKKINEMFLTGGIQRWVEKLGCFSAWKTTGNRQLPFLHGQTCSLSFRLQRQSHPKLSLSWIPKCSKSVSYLSIIIRSIFILQDRSYSQDSLNKMKISCLW